MFVVIHGPDGHGGTVCHHKQQLHRHNHLPRDQDENNGNDATMRNKNKNKYQTMRPKMFCHPLMTATAW